MSGFDLLHPVVQHHVVSSLGWPRLRPLQDEAIAPILAGEHVLALAPTAGGKTEAAALPLLSRILSEREPGLSVLYLCPLRALLNNLHPRLERYGSYCGIRVGLWHGDVTPGARRRILDEPPEILLTTPESLEGMLLSVRTDHAALFAHLRTVVIDEVHAFGGDDRGWHLLAVLERLSRLAGRDLQRVGLSATVGDPDRLLRWLVGSSVGPARVVAPDVGSALSAAAAASPTDVTLDHVGSLANAAIVLSSMHAGEKRLVFCDSRAQVEELATMLREREVNTFVSHSSLSADERRRAEEAFAEASDCVIVATSTLELGIDVGDLDRVVQVNSPATVASFLQRLGRTGRRPGSVRNMLFLTTGEGIETAKAAGLLHLWATGYVEPIVAPPRPLHLFAQQVLALALQQGGVGRNLWPESLGQLPEFAALVASGEAERIVAHLVATGMLVEDGGLLSVGPEGERSYGYRHFLDLTSAFTSEPLFAVRYGARDLGQVAPVCLLNPDRTLATVLLGGHSWKVGGIDWRRKVAWVEPSGERGRSRWSGGGQPWSYQLCQAIREVLAGTDPRGVILTRRAVDRLAESRAEMPWARSSAPTVVRDDTSARWWTWAGESANATLADALGDLRGSGPVDNLSISVDRDRATSDTISERLASLDVDRLPAPSVTAAMAEHLKFSDCLPVDLAESVAAARLLDPAGVAAVTAHLGAEA